MLRKFHDLKFLPRGTGRHLLFIPFDAPNCQLVLAVDRVALRSCPTLPNSDNSIQWTGHDEALRSRHKHMREADMADGFEQMADEALAFFAKLQKNNSKDWFEPYKAHYKDTIAGPAGFFADLMAEDIARITGKPHIPKVFRIYRDVRFSKDKTPFNTHLHIMWSPADKNPAGPAWFWGLAQDYFVLGMGLMSLQGQNLTRYRAFVDKHGNSLQDALNQTGLGTRRDQRLGSRTAQACAQTL